VPDLDLAELVKQHLAGGPSVQESLGGLAESDPQLAPVMRLLAQREEQLQQELAREEEAALDEQREEERLADQRRRAAALRAHLDELTAELAAMRAKLGDVAAALGACPTCLGEEPTCVWCRGRGAPGFMPPDPEGFNRLVLPAVLLYVRLNRRPHIEVDDRATAERSAS
jgi:hypothetical protein